MLTHDLRPSLTSVSGGDSQRQLELEALAAETTHPVASAMLREAALHRASAEQVNTPLPKKLWCLLISAMTCRATVWDGLKVLTRWPLVVLGAAPRGRGAREAEPDR